MFWIYAKKLFLVLLITFLITGCAKQDSREVITFSSWGSATEVKILKNVISEFEKENSDIKINFIHVPQNYFQKIHLLFASNTAPDVIFINNLYLPQYAKFLEPLDNYFEKPNFYPQAINGLSYNNQLLAIPRDISNLVFYINNDIFKSKNINLPPDNWTLKDLLNIAIKLTDKNIYGLSYEDNIYWAMPYLYYFGEEIIKNNGDINFDIVENSQGLEFYKNLKTKYQVVPTKSQIGSSTLAQMFLEGKIAMYLSGRWIYPKISEQAKFNWSIMTFPIGKYGVAGDASGWAISKNSKHKYNALKFIEFLSNKKNIEDFVDTGLIIPARIDCTDKINNLKHNEKMFIKALTTSKPTTTSKDYNKITDYFNQKMVEFIGE